MNGPPEAESEYSRGRRPARGPEIDPQAAWERRFERHRRGVLAAGLLGVLLLLVAEFAPVLHVHSALRGYGVRSVTGGRNHSFALLPVALLAAALSLSVWQTGSRIALLAIGVLGLVALGVALLGDLPDAHTAGLVGNTRTGHAFASSQPAMGLYLETAGGVVLLLAAAAGMLLEPVPGTPRRGGSRRSGRRASRSVS